MLHVFSFIFAYRLVFLLKLLYALCLGIKRCHHYHLQLLTRRIQIETFKQLPRLLNADAIELRILSLSLEGKYGCDVDNEWHGSPHISSIIVQKYLTCGGKWPKAFGHNRDSVETNWISKALPSYRTKALGKIRISIIVAWISWLLGGPNRKHSTGNRNSVATERTNPSNTKKLFLLVHCCFPQTGMVRRALRITIQHFIQLYSKDNSI